MPPSAERRKRLQDGISGVQKVAAVELGFCGAPRCFRGTWVYIGGRSRSVDARGAHEGGGAPTPIGRPPIVALSGGHRPTSSSYIYPRTPKTSREPTKNNFHRRNLLYPRDPILEPSPALYRRGESTTEGLYINILAPPMSCE